jgi:hypothetical protein
MPNGPISRDREPALGEVGRCGGQAYRPLTRQQSRIPRTLRVGKMKPWTVESFSAHITDALDLVASASDQYSQLIDEHTEYLTDPEVDDPDLAPPPPSQMWLKTMAVAVGLRSSLDWTAYAFHRQFSASESRRRTPSFPLPRSNPPRGLNSVVVAKEFEGVARRNPRLLLYLEGIELNSRGDYDWLTVLHELANEMKHRMPLRQRPRARYESISEAKTGWEYTRATVWLSAETEFMEIPNVLGALGEAGCGVLEIFRNVATLTGATVSVQADGPFAPGPRAVGKPWPP